MPSPASRRPSRVTPSSKKPHIWIASVCLFVGIAVGFVALFRYAFASDGSGTNAVSPGSVVAGSTGNALAFTFTAAETMSSGEISIAAPDGWNAPQGTPGTAGYVTAASSGVIADVLNALDASSGWGSTRHMTLSADTGDKQEGTASLLNTIGATAAANEQWYFNYGSPANWGGTATGNLRVGMWLKSSVGTALGDYSWQNDDTAGLASPTDTVAIPALQAGTWTYTSVTLGATTRPTIASYGFRYTNDTGASTLRADSIAPLFNTADSTTGGKSDGGITRSFLTTAGDVKEGSAAWRCSYAASAGVGTSGDCYFNNTNDMIGPGGSVSFWIRPSVALNAGDFVWIDDDSADFGSPRDIVNVPALPANTWTYVTLSAPNSSNIVVKSYGFRQIVDKGALTLDVDAMGKQIDAADAIAGWTTSAASAQTVSSDAAVFHEGTASLKNVLAASATAGDAWYQTLAAPQDWTSYTTVGLWIRSTVATTAGQLKFEYSTTPDLRSPIASVSVGALPANAWSYQTFALSGTRATVQSYGVNYTSDIGAATIYLDDVLVGPGKPTFPGGGVIRTRLLSLTDGQSVVVTYGSGGGANGVTAPTAAGDFVFTTQSRASDAGSLQTIPSSPVVTVTPASTSQFFLNDPGDITAGTRVAYAVTRKDAYGNLVTSGPQTVYLYSSSTGNAAFYASESGGSPIASVVIADGASVASVWYQDDRAGAFTVTASDNAAAPDGAAGIVDASDGIAVHAGAVARFSLTDPGDMEAGTRLGYSVSREDAFGNAVTLGSDTVFLYSDSANSPAFFAAAEGGAPITSVTIANASSSVNFWHYDEAAGSSTVTASDHASAPDGTAGIDDAQDTVSVRAAATGSFSLSGPGEAFVGARVAYTVTRRDTFGNTDTNGTDTVHLYSDSTGNAAFYAVETGGSPVSSVVIGDGSSSATFWYEDDRVASVIVTVSDNASAPDGTDGIDDDSDSLTLVVAPASRFVIVQPASAAVGELMEVTVRAEDAFGNLDVTYQGDVTLDASGSATGDGLVDVVDGIGRTEISDVVVETVRLTLRDTEGTGLDVSSARDAEFTTGPTRVFELTDPGDMVAGTRIAYTVTRRDAFDNLVTAGSQTVYLFTDSDGSGAFYNEVEEGSQILSVSIGSGESSAMFWYEDDTAGSLTVYVSDNGLGPDGLEGIDDAQDGVVVSPASAAHFQLSDPGDAVAGERVGYVVSREDQFGNLATSGDTSVRLYTDSAGPAFFYDVEVDGFPVTEVTIADGASEASFWYVGERTGTDTVTVSDGLSEPNGDAGINDASDNVVISPGPTFRFLLDNPGDVTVGTRIGYVVTRKDAYGNLVTDGEDSVHLFSDSTGGYAFYDAAVDGNAVDTVGIEPGNSTARFWYADDAGGVWFITASDNPAAPDGAEGIADATDTLNVTTIPIVATRILMLNPTDATAGDAVVVTLRAVDDFGSIDTTFEGSVGIEKTGSATGAGVVSFAGGVGTVEVSDTVAETVVLTLRDIENTLLNMDSSQDVVFAPGPTYAFAINDPGDTVAGTRVGYVVTRTDAYGNPVTTGSDVANLLSSAGGLARFYDAAEGGGQITAFTLVEGASTASFWYANEQAVSDTITVDGAARASDDIRVAPGATERYALTDPGDMSVGTRLAYAVTRTDAYGNPVTAGSETVYLYTSSPGPTAAFYDASSGGSAVTSVTLADGESSGAFWYFDEADGLWLVTVSDGVSFPNGDEGVNDGSDTVTVTNIPISATRFELLDPTDVPAGSSTDVTIRAVDDFGSVDTLFRGKVTLVLSGTATGGGVVSFVSGIGTARITDANEGIVTLSLLDTDATGLDVGSTQSVRFLSPGTGGGGAAPDASGAEETVPAVEPVPVIPTVLRFDGRAYPGATVSLVGVSATERVTLSQTAVASADGSFALSYEGPFDALVSFEILVVDAEGLALPAIAFSPEVPAEQTTSLSVTVPPSVHLFRRAALRGNAVPISGFAQPGSTLEVVVDGGSRVETVKTKGDGSYKLFLDTASMDFGPHALDIRSLTADGAIADVLGPRILLVSRVLNADTDLNQDGYVDISDWSMFLVQWSSPDPSIRGQLDFNGDGVVDISDFSIFVRSIRS